MSFGVWGLEQVGRHQGGGVGFEVKSRAWRVKCRASEAYDWCKLENGCLFRLPRYLGANEFACCRYPCAWHPERGRIETGALQLSHRAEETVNAWQLQLIS